VVGGFSKMMGIYKIQNKITGQIYIGCSLDIAKRWGQHLHDLKSGKHYNKKLSYAFEEYGFENFTFEIVELIDAAEQIFEIEQKYIDTINLDDHYNIVNSFGKNKIHKNQDIEKFICYISERWLVPNGTENFEKYSIYKKEDKEEIVMMAIQTNLIYAYPSEFTFFKIYTIMKNGLGYLIESKQSRINKKSVRHKLIIGFDESKIDLEYINSLKWNTKTNNFSSPIDKPQHS
jgi:hypothetical protein